MPENSNPNLKTFLALSLISGLGSKRIKFLAKAFDDPSKIFNLSKTELRSVESIGEASALSILSFNKWDEVDQIIKATEKVKAHIITIADSEYPPHLKQIYDPPALFWLKGNPEALSKPGIGVIGTRHATSYGKKTAEKLSKALGEQGLCIFSGLAHGIDAISHKAALDVKAPTVAVLGSGIDNLYPRENADLANRIVKEGGAVITEFPLGTAPDAGNFPVRNRIVSGMSLGVLVVESGIKGGSMITADLALDQNREVFAVPHSLDNLSGSGCNYLIKTGAAKLVQTVDDILEELPIDQGETSSSTKKELPSPKLWKDEELDELSKKVCEFLESGEAQIDAIADELELNTSQLLVTLLQLEMRELVVQKVGKVFSLK
ncbi:MAG: DNA-protecting protein DprA [Balneolaceae bacterium]|nr:DNA-protecting protein DprA [Balneolaceae bacterium]MBO6547686.1 DNA-protecting protein DprA [Balneolaceae bacterium]MBO6648197.1 DNA-protecting protein DprA [Balneolaceae bacterium]